MTTPGPAYDSTLLRRIDSLLKAVLAVVLLCLLILVLLFFGVHAGGVNGWDNDNIDLNPPGDVVAPLLGG